LLAAVMSEHGRQLSELELVGGIRGRFTGPDGIADLDEALADLPRQLAQGFTTICFKPAMFVRSAAEVGGLCRELVTRVAGITGGTRTPGTPSP
jgi:hypothetical protein